MTIPRLDPDHIPRHIAIIMDGNGRWAQRKGLARAIGHKAGVESVQKIVKAGRELGIKVLTLYAFSAENWQRPALEVKTLMSLLKSYLKQELSNLTRNNIQLRAIGEVEKLPAEVRNVLTETIKRTAANNGMILNLALSYGSRQEIIRAVKSIAEKCLNGELQSTAINEDVINGFLYTSGLPDPDMIIRTGGESRLSNFLLWQASYAEIYITETAWPNFRRNHLISAIADYQKRQRRFGKTGEQIQEQS